MGKVRVHIPASLRQYWGGAAQAHVEGRTLREALLGLGALSTRILDDAGELRPHVHVFVNAAAARALDAPLSDGDVVHVLPAVSGGLA